MLSLATEADRTLFFDFLPIDLGTIRGMKTRIQLYTVPGQVFYNATRRMVLKGADCVVFVADSQEPMLDANLDALANLKENLEANEIDPEEIPTVLQYNKRDLPNALPVEILNERLNPRGLPFFEAVAMKGQGVDETLKGGHRARLQVAGHQIRRRSGARRSGPTPRRRPAAAPRAPAPAPAAPAVRRRSRGAARRLRRMAPGPAAAVAAPSRRRPGSGHGGRSTDELLESIDLQPAASSSMIVRALASGPGPRSRPSPPKSFRWRRLRPPSSPSIGRTTLIRTASEADDMRARIGRTTDPELTLDAADPDDEDIEEISFDTAPNLVPENEPAPAARARAPGRGRPPAAGSSRARPRAPAAAAPPAAPRTLPPTRPPGRPRRRRSATIPPVAATSARPGENTAPIRVSATVQRRRQVRRRARRGDGAQRAGSGRDQPPHRPRPRKSSR